MPAPSNDNFASAQALSTTLPGSLTGQTNRDATKEVGEPFAFFGEDDGRSVWYTFTPTASGRYRFRLHNATTGWTNVRYCMFSLYTGSAVGSLTEIYKDILPSISADDGAVCAEAEIIADLTSGVTYRIRVASPFFTGDGTNGYTVNFDLEWDSVATGTPPANDDLADIIDLGTDPADGNTAGTTIDASTETWEVGTFITANQDPSVWYRFHSTVTTTREMHVVRPDGSDLNTRLYFSVWEILNDPPVDWDDLPTLVGDGSIDANVDPYDTAGMVPIEAGKDYVIQVSSYNPGAGHQDDYTLVFGAYIAPSAPDNDNPEDTPFTHQFYFDRSEFGAYWVYPEAAERDGTTELATSEAGEGALAGFAATRTVWYHFGIDGPGTYKIWVESAVDCVLGLYGEPNTWADPTDLTLIASDDDSGPGDQPEINHTFGALVAPFFGDYWLAVDSKIEGAFTLKYQRQSDGTPPANDDFASATVISSVPYSAAGTTVAATAETLEREASELSTGPKDTVWYKYVATFNGQLKIKATCDTNNDDGYVYVDGWHGTTLANLARHPEPPPTGPGGGIFRGFFNHFDTPSEIDQAAITLDVQNGETYYIRVQTESGGSEDFTIYVEVQAVYLDLQPSGSDEMHGTLIDSGTVYLDLQVTSVEVFRPALTTDASTVYVDLQPASVDIKGFEYLDSATVLVDVRVVPENDCYFHTEPSFIADGQRKWAWSEKRRWSASGTRRWAWIEGEGLPQVC